MRWFLSVLSALASFLCASAQRTIAVADTLQRNIEEVAVTGIQRRTPKLIPGQLGVEWNMSLLDDLPKILGNADPMHYAQTLPGVQTNNEYDGGLHIFGCDNSHNYVSIDGAPIYNANHLLGLFSVFNPSHFQTMTLHKTANNASFPNRLGGMVNLRSRDGMPDSLCGNVTVGLISSQGTLHVPLGRKNGLSVSARGSYLNLLYGYAMKADESQLEYSFGDVNITWLYQPGNADKIKLDAYWGEDDARMVEKDYQADIRLRWGNTLTSLLWEHSFTEHQEMSHSLYFTKYHSRLQLDQLMGFTLPSSISDVGYRWVYEAWWVDAGIDAVWHHVCPLSPSASGDTWISHKREQPSYESQELSAWTDTDIPLSKSLSLNAGVRATLFIYQHGKHYSSADPSFSLRYDGRSWNWSLTASLRHQYLFQSNFSATGLPTEGWSQADTDHRPQSGLNLHASVGKRMTEWGLQVFAEVYYKQLRHQLEYQGTALDFLSFGDTDSSMLYTSRGRNYGINLTVMKTVGRLSGWVSYNWGRAKRHYDKAETESEWFPASHERIHELNAVVTYKAGQRWNFGATYVMASGTPFTMPEYVFLYGGYPVSHFGGHNSRRLKGYSRLDLSANCRLSSAQQKERGINVSLYNALGQRNELFYSWHVSRTGSFAYRPVSFLLKVMPSVSFYAKF